VGFVVRFKDALGLLNATSRAKPFAPFEANETSTKERTWKREEIVVIFV
jgi:hypothetical protein